MPYAAVNGLDMYYEVHLADPPLLLLHGGAGLISPTWISFFSAEYRVIAMDCSFDYRDMVLDPAVIAELRAATGDDDRLIAELIATYLGEGSEGPEGMEAAVAAGDASALVRPAHTLKSSSASIGAMALCGLCRAIGEAAREGRADGLPAEVERAQAAWIATSEALAAAGLAR